MRVPAAFAFLVLLSISHAAAQAPSHADVAARLKELADNYTTRDRRETLKLVEPIVARPDLTPADRVEALRIKGNAEVAVGSNDLAVATLLSAMAALAADTAQRAQDEDAERQEQLTRWHEQDRADELDQGLDNGPSLGMG